MKFEVNIIFGDEVTAVVEASDASAAIRQVKDAHRRENPDAGKVLEAGARRVDR